MKKKLQTKFHTRQYMLSEDFEIYYYNDAHFSGVESHTHDYYEFYFFLEGDMGMHINGTFCPLKHGDMLLIPPNCPHHAESTGTGKPYRRFVFWIGTSFYNQLKQLSSDFSYVFQQAAMHGRYHFHFDMIAFNSVQARIFRLIEEIHSDRFGKESMVSLCVNDLLLHLNRTIYEEDHQDLSHAQQHLYESLIQYIEDHLDDDLSLDQLASIFYVSKFHISHVFKDNLGVSVHQYITKKRLSMCRDAILGSEGISKVYLMYGFKDYSSFFRAFRKEYGISPKEYKDVYSLSELNGKKNTD